MILPTLAIGNSEASAGSASVPMKTRPFVAETAKFAWFRRLKISARTEAWCHLRETASLAFAGSGVDPHGHLPGCRLVPKRGKFINTAALIISNRGGHARFPTWRLQKAQVRFAGTRDLRIVSREMACYSSRFTLVASVLRIGPLR